jgi:DNA-binding NtrC family response regulator
MSAQHVTDSDGPVPTMTVLVLSHDAVAAALLGGLVETLGYDVRFARMPETVEDSIRRVRPRICLIGCEDSTLCSAETLGRAAMRGIAVLIFGPRQALEQVRALAAEHRIETIIVPPNMEELEDKLQRAVMA